jgi:hypothetical protein
MIIATLPTRGDKLTRPEIAKRGKAATALVHLPPTGPVGTAFSVHASGYFIAAESLFSGRPDDVDIALVLDPGLKTEKLLKARLVRRDQKLGVALLRADGVKDLPSLSLGSAEKLGELAELVMLGFPTEVKLAKEKPDYPSAIVDIATVTSLTRKEGDPIEFQMKSGATAVTPGGPVLDENAALVGVVVASTRDASRAIPVNRLAQFLSIPDIRFTAPTVTRAKQDEPVEFQARIESVLPPARPPNVELALRVGEGGPEQRHKMTLKDGVYRVLAAPVPKELAERLELTAQFESGSVSGLVADREFQVGAQKLRLS